MGEGAWLEGVFLVSVPTMPVPLIKARGQPGRMLENNPHCLAATTECGEWPGQALQDVSILQATGGGGGGRVGNVLVTINIPVEISLYSVLAVLFLRSGWRLITKLWNWCRGDILESAHNEEHNSEELSITGTVK